jgi:hypothetical protein
VSTRAGAPQPGERVAQGEQHFQSQHVDLAMAHPHHANVSVHVNVDHGLTVSRRWAKVREPPLLRGDT